MLNLCHNASRTVASVNRTWREVSTYYQTAGRSCLKFHNGDTCLEEQVGRGRESEIYNQHLKRLVEKSHVIVSEIITDDGCLYFNNI